MPADEQGVLILATGVACVIVAVGWAVCAIILVVLMNRRVRKLEQAAPGPYPREDIALLYYAVSALFGVAAIPFTLLLMREARTARTGRTCGIVGIVHMSAIV